MENKTQDYQSEILAIIRGNTSPGVMRNKLEDYHENDLADVFSELTAAERRKVCRILNLDMLQTFSSILMRSRQQSIWMRWMCARQRVFFQEWRQMPL